MITATNMKNLADYVHSGRQNVASEELNKIRTAIRTAANKGEYECEVLGKLCETTIEQIRIDGFIVKCSKDHIPEKVLTIINWSACNVCYSSKP